MSNGIDLGALRGALAGSVSGDAHVRAAADAHLEAAAAQSGAALGLLQIASDPSVDLPTRQSASIYFKNLTNKSWAQREGSVPTAPAAKRLLDEGEKAAVRRVALEAVANTPSKVRSQLVEAVRVIVHHDFPGRWPEVANQVLDGLNAASSSESGKAVRDGFGVARAVSKV
jgi:exportin-2 (importin alpha re-exporter)